MASKYVRKSDTYFIQRKFSTKQNRESKRKVTANIGTEKSSLRND
jgi:hypothetical protein